MHDLKNPEIFIQLYEKVYRDLYHYALYTLGNVQDAEDAVGEAVLDAYAGIHNLRSKEAFRSWIFAILSAKCKRKLKEYVNKSEVLREDLPKQGTSLEEAVQVRALFGKLAEEDRILVSLRVWGGYNSKEIGEMLRMNDGTVRSRISRALGKLRTWMS